MQRYYPHLGLATIASALAGGATAFPEQASATFMRSGQPPKSRWRSGSTKKRRKIDRAAIKAQRKASVRTRRGW